jgi:uncharacterized protein
MIKRFAFETVRSALTRQAAIVLIGSQQVGKTTLAIEISDLSESLYLDLESRKDRNRLDDPVSFLTVNKDKLIVWMKSIVCLSYSRNYGASLMKADVRESAQTGF